MILVDSLDDCIDEGSRRGPRCQFEIPGLAQKLMILVDDLDDCIDEGSRQAPRCQFEIRKGVQASPQVSI